ncbi:uncharacterized protein A1O5_12825 [Cladophialophora psammophila CBS 110553]|uniref:Uncharacterized protein n=1 Tax=Cladophialophora psammophila CBS 110553 TaxID=1182543 RepID=W9W8N3_9EURO|nr:uncharacterized protein A1O5_12825 [Cladophialophora psammophila CBS 110553]EXJ54914.1 hypothetical protein A1O5_12825 [Cladophialophora psammophila CBS 110553]
MTSSNPTSPILPTLSPLSPQSPIVVENELVQPLRQLLTTFSGLTSTQTSITSPNPWACSNTNGTICRRNSLASPVMMSPAQAAFVPISPARARHQMSTPERAHFQMTHTPMTATFPREDGRQSRMAMRSPTYERVFTLPLRVNTIFASETIHEETDQSEYASTPSSDTSTLFDWEPANATASASRTTTTASNGRRLIRSHTPAPIRTQTRSPIRKQSQKHSRLPPKLRLPPLPQYHVEVILSPTSRRNREHYQSSVEHLRAPLVPLISVTTGLPHPEFPTSLLQYHLLTHEQLDSLARWYHQVTPPVEETFQYPAWIPAWTSLPRNRQQNPNTAADQKNVDLETKRRRWGRFIGLRGCESPTDESGNVLNGGGGEEQRAETPDELARRMGREWRRALERAEEEARSYEKSWRGRW